jgi:hypothetical protein
MGKYPTPNEATSRFTDGVQFARDKWVTRTTQGAGLYQTWYTGFANTIYPVIAGLPAKTGNVDVDIDQRVKPVANAIRKLSYSYRATRLREIAKQLSAVVTVRG